MIQRRSISKTSSAGKARGLSEPARFFFFEVLPRSPRNRNTSLNRAILKHLAQPQKPLRLPKILRQNQLHPKSPTTRIRQLRLNFQIIRQSILRTKTNFMNTVFIFDFKAEAEFIGEFPEFGIFPKMSGLGPGLMPPFVQSLASRSASLRVGHSLLPRTSLS